VFFAFLILLLLAANSLKNTYALWKLSQDLILIRDNKERDLEGDAEEVSVGAADGKSVEVAAAPERVVITKSLSERVWEKAGKEPSEGAFLVVEYKRVTEAQARICWIMMAFEVAIFFVWPTASLLIVSWNVGALFVPVAFIWGVRHYINAAVIIEETGNMDLVDGDTEEKKWQAKSRLNTIVETITVNRSRKLWLSILGGTYWNSNHF
jgi:hypothetical protein